MKQGQTIDNYLSNRFEHKESLASVRANKKQWLSENYLSLLPSNKEALMLEIGPGYGEMLEWLVHDLNYSNFHIIDISKEVIDFCETIVPNKGTLIEDPSVFIASEVDKGKFFDAIFMFQVLEHIQKKESLILLTQIQKSLSPEGILVIEIPNMANPLVGTIMRYDDFTHEIGYTTESLIQVLKASGFSRITTGEVSPPKNSFFRFIQRSLQLFLNRSFQLLAKVYFPSKNIIMSPSIYAVARR